MLQSTDFYLLRAPLYSKEKLIKLNTALEERNYSLVRKIFSDDLFLNAIYLSSKDFYFIAKSWLDQSIEYFEFRDKVFISLYKYYNRLCTRATPYGFFSGFSTGEIGNFPTNIKRDDKNPFNFHVRPDMGYIEDVKNSIIYSNSISNFEYVPNNSIYKISNKIRYVLRDVNNNFEICEIKINFILNKILGFTKDGKTKIEIIGFLEKLNFKKEEILEYLHQLIESQILVVKCPPFLSSNSQYSDFFKFFEKFEKSTELQKKIEKIKFNINPLYNTANFLAQLNLSSQDSIDQFVQIDTELNMKNNHINKNVVNNITKTLNELLKISKKKTSLDFQTFKNNFFNRYELQEVQLVKVFDPVSGLGYGSQQNGDTDYMPLIDGLPISNTAQEQMVQNDFVSYIYKKYYKCFNSSEIKPIILTEEDLNWNVKSEEYTLFENYYLLGNIIYDTYENLDKGNFKFNSIYSYPSPFMASVLSRFSIYDSKLNQNIVNSCFRNTDKYIFAEIIHQPEGRIGNVLLRNNYFDFEIPYLSLPNPNKKVIDINDLYISHNGNRIILRSKKYNKEVIPRLTTAHNFQRENLPLFRFLGDYQFENHQTGFRWDWSFLKNCHFLPRVEYKNFILAKAQWTIFKKKLNHNDFLTLIKDSNLPRFCELIENSDNVIQLDLSNIVCQNILIDKVKEKDVTIFESDIMNINLNVKELVFTFTTPETSFYQQFRNKKRKIDLKIERKFYPSDNWKFFKLYCPISESDAVIKNLSTVIKQAIKLDSNCKWFFIKFFDPNFHIRFRINTNLSVDEISKQIKKVNKKLIDNDILSNIVIGTYSREIERYGSELIEVVEDYFFYDSDAILKIISQFENYENVADLRWHVALYSINALFDDFKVSIDDRKTIMRDLFYNFQNEFILQSDQNVRKQFKKTLNNKFYSQRHLIIEIIENQNIDNPMKKIIAKRSTNLKNSGVVNKINGSGNFNEIIKSLIHMNLNRLYVAHVRRQEMVTYYFLFKYYDMVKSRHK